jgi:hypothetical protein
MASKKGKQLNKKIINDEKYKKKRKELHDEFKKMSKEKQDKIRL